ncbi:MAG: DUF4316 domain-containing protein [Ruminococcus sp.]|nr:DUF4316 domain-containing protein [Ruminococcus sp.]
MPVMDLNKNATAYMSEEDVLEMYEKIQQNRSESQKFAEDLDKFASGKMSTNEVITVGVTPNALRIAGEALKGTTTEARMLTVNQSVLQNSMNAENIVMHGHTTGHDLSLELLKQLPEHLRNPIMICQGSKDNSIAVITELTNKNGKNILASVNIDVRGKTGQVDKITSIYGKDDMKAYLEHNTILAYNKEKAERLFTDIGADSPQATSIICFDNSIAYSTQNVKYPQENNLEQSVERPATEKLLPFLNAKANNLNAKLEVRAEKIEVQENAIAQREAKIDKLSARADRLADMNLMLKSTVGSLPFVQKLIERNENKINKIRSKQIPRQEEKIKEHDNAILQLEKESSVIQHKLDRCLALNDTIRSFTISNNAERRQKFAQAMDNLHSSTLNCMIDKRAELREQAAVLENKYNDPIYNNPLYAMDKASIASTIRKTNNRIDKLTDKINTLSGATTPVTGRTDAQIDTAMECTSDKISEHMEKSDFSMPAISEAVCVEVIVQPEQQREQDNPLKNAEMAMEDDYNSIDGIINNGKKEVDIPQQSAEMPSNEATQPVAETQKEAENSKRTISGTINQGYYKSLAPSDRLITIQPREVAERMMSRLEFENVQFSAVSKANDMVALTVSKSDEAVLRSVEEAAINDNGTFLKFLNREHDNLRDESHFNQHDLTEFEARSISDQLTKKGIANTAMLNADESMVTISTKDAQKAMPFMSSSDLITVQPNKIAHKIMDNLNKQGITYSAQPRNNSVFITVSPKDQPALDSAREAAKQQQCKEFINSDYYKSLPKEERFTQRMSESDARSAIQQLADKGIEHSAVLAGRKSAVTVSIKDEQKARPYLSNKQRQKEAQRIKQQPKHEKTPEKQRKQKQEIG